MTLASVGAGREGDVGVVGVLQRQPGVAGHQGAGQAEGVVVQVVHLGSRAAPA